MFETSTGISIQILVNSGDTHSKKNWWEKGAFSKSHGVFQLGEASTLTKNKLRNDKKYPPEI